MANDDQLIKIFEKYSKLDQDDFSFMTHERVSAYALQIYNQIRSPNLELKDIFGFASPQLIQILEDML